MTATTITNNLAQKRMFNYRDDGGVPKHTFFDGHETKTLYDIAAISDILLNAYDYKLRDVNTRLGKSFTPSWTITSSG